MSDKPNPEIEATKNCGTPHGGRGLKAEDLPKKTFSNWFGKFAAQASLVVGSRWAFTAAVLVIVIWAVTGPLFHYSDSWQLVINTGTTIITFLMVFLIQNTQNRDAKAINLKLNELIHAVDKAKNHMIDIESLSDEELKDLAGTYESMRVKYLAREELLAKKRASKAEGAQG